MIEPTIDNDQDTESEPDSEPPPRLPTFVQFFAWCPPAHRLDTFLAVIASCVGPSQSFEVSDRDTGPSAEASVTLAEAARLLGEQYPRHLYAFTNFSFNAPSGCTFRISASVFSERMLRQNYAGPIAWGAWPSPLPSEVPLAHDPVHRTMQLSAAIVWHWGIVNVFDNLAQIYSASSAITTCVCTSTYNWNAPVLMGATYHADGNPLRDLAMSWMVLRDEYVPDPNDVVRLSLAAGWSLDELRRHVESADAGSSVPIVGHELLTREQVLAALALPKEDLLRALEQSATKTHPEWKAIEPDIARELQALEKADVGEVELIPLNQEHIDFLKDHSPAFVKRLENGAVVLLAHPYRTLWPLWADALRLLGIRP